MRRHAREEVRHLPPLERFLIKEQPVLGRHEGNDAHAHVLLRRVLRAYYLAQRALRLRRGLSAREAFN